MRNNLGIITMKKIKIHIITLLLMALAITLTPVAALAAGTCTDSDGQTITTSVLDCPGSTEGRALIWQLLTIGVNFLAVGVGLAVVAGIVFGAFTYASAGGNAEQTKKGISYITNAVIGLLLFIFMYAIINFLVPGGVL